MAAEPSITIGFRLEYAGLVAFDRLMRLVSVERAARFSGWLWRSVAPLLSRHRRADEHLAAMIPEYSTAERQSILRAMWGHLGQTFLETLHLDRIAAEPDRIPLDAHTKAIVGRVIAEGGIVVMAHIGNWEASALPMKAAGAVHSMVYRRAKNPLVDAHIQRQRGRYYTGDMLAKGHAAARGLLRLAQAGRSIGMMADLRENGGIEVPFFGRNAPSTPMPALLARHYGRPLFAARMVRSGTTRFHVEIVEIGVERTADRAADIRAATARVNAVFEMWIRQWPEQWMWAHRRY